MKSIYIKRAFYPTDYALYRKATVKTSSGKKYKLAQLEEIKIDCENEQWIEFKLDYFKRRVELNSPTDDVYIALTLNYESYFKSIFKNCLQAEIVDKNTYDNLESNIAKDDTKSFAKQFKVKDYITVALSIITNLWILISLIFNKNVCCQRNLLFLIIILSLVSTITLLTSRKKLTVQKFNTAIISSISIAILITAFFGNVVFFGSWLMVLITLQLFIAFTD